MIIAPAAAIVIGLGVLAAAVVWLIVTRAYLWQRRGRKAIFHTKQGQSIEGILAGRYRDGIVLAGARMLDTDGPVSMAGEVFIPKGDIAIVQYVP